MVIPGPALISTGPYNYTVTVLSHSLCLDEAVGELSLGWGNLPLLSLLWTPTSPIPGKSVSFRVSTTNPFDAYLTVTACNLQLSSGNSAETMYNTDCKGEAKPNAAFTASSEDFTLGKGLLAGEYVYRLSLIQDDLIVGSVDGSVLVGGQFPLSLHITSPSNTTISSQFLAQAEVTNLSPSLIQSKYATVSLFNSTSYYQLEVGGLDTPFSPGYPTNIGRLIMLQNEVGSLTLQIEIYSEEGLMVGLGTLPLEVTTAQLTAFSVFPLALTSDYYAFLTVERSDEAVQPSLAVITNYTASCSYWLLDLYPTTQASTVAFYLRMEDMSLEPGDYVMLVFDMYNRPSPYTIVTILPPTHVWTNISTTQFPPFQLFPGSVVDMEIVLQTQGQLPHSLSCEGVLWNSTKQWTLQSSACDVVCEVATCQLSLVQLTVPESGEYVLQLETGQGSVSTLIYVGSFTYFTPGSISLLPSCPLPGDVLSLSLTGTSTSPFFPEDYLYYLWNATFQLSLNGTTDAWPVSPGPGAFLVSVPELLYVGSESIETGEYMLAICLNASTEVCWESAVTVIEGPRAEISNFQWIPSNIIPGSNVSFSFSLRSISQGDFDSSVCSLLIYNSLYSISPILDCPAGIVSPNSSVEVQSAAFQLPSDMESGQYLVRGWLLSKLRNQNSAFSTTLNITLPSRSLAYALTFLGIALSF